MEKLGTENMDSHICLYCGKTQTSQAETQKKDTPAFCECPHCGRQYTKWDEAKEQERINRLEFYQDADNPDNHVSEEEIIQSAWELMKNEEWEKAQDRLFQRGQPLRYSPIFSAYRDVCRAAARLAETDLDKRYLELDILKHNLEIAKRELAGFSGKDLLEVLRRIYEALMLLGSLQPASRKNIPVKHASESLVNSTNQKRSDALEVFALYLWKETPENGEFRAECLKMAVQLLHKCLEIGQEEPGTFINRSNKEMLQISQPTRKRIKEAINAINPAISRLDPAFVPTPPLPDPKMVPLWYEILSIAILAPILLSIDNVFLFILAAIFLLSVIVFIAVKCFSN